MSVCQYVCVVLLFGSVSSSCVQLSMSGQIISCSFSKSVLVFDLSDLKRVREVIRALKISKQWCNVMGVSMNTKRDDEQLKAEK